MREIKFKIWDKEKNRMSKPIPVYWPFVEWSDGDINMPTDFAISKNERFTFLEFSGLKDKNGKEVYSGDLYEVAGNKVYEVRYVDKMQVQSGGFETFGACFVLWVSDELFFPFDEYAMEHGKVIGNIYETPTP